MKIQVKRIFLGDTYTIGRMYLNGKYECDTLEDKVRDTNKDGKLDEPKVFGETAIPYGVYKVIINYSNRFKRDLPRLLSVPDFDGILIHSGNTKEDTHGCILVGINDQKGRVSKSKITFDSLFSKLKNEKTIEIEIT